MATTHTLTSSAGSLLITPATFSLGDTIDQIILQENNTEIARLNYTGLPFGLAGMSAELVSLTISPSKANYQLITLTTYGVGDLGTPGVSGSFELSNASTIPYLERYGYLHPQCY